jgi:hypothetical protein
MQRKLFRSMTALSATATLFSLLLLAAGPASAPTPAPLAADVVLASADAAAVPALEAAADPVSAASRQRHHLHRARALLALPYFSFAQGLRRGRS